MTVEQRRLRNLDKARAASAAARVRRREERAAAFSVAQPAYQEAVGNYYLVRSAHGEGSPEEKVAFRSMLKAEVTWFECHPRDGELVAA